MAERLDEFPEGLEPSQQGNRGFYPWHDWADGGVWKLVHNEDFHTSNKSIDVAARKHAKKMGLNLLCRKTYDMMMLPVKDTNGNDTEEKELQRVDIVYLQFLPKGEEVEGEEVEGEELGVIGEEVA